MTRTNFKEKSMKNRSLVTKEAVKDTIRTQENQTTLTTHPETSHNIKLNQKGGCPRLFKEKLRIYATFGQKLACIRDFWLKICVCT